MKLSEAVRHAIRGVRDALARADGSELEVYRAFAEEFDALLEGWNMRIEELEVDGEDEESEEDECDE